MRRASDTAFGDFLFALLDEVTQALIFFLRQGLALNDKVNFFRFSDQSHFFKF